MRLKHKNIWLFALNMYGTYGFVYGEKITFLLHHDYFLSFKKYINKLRRIFHEETKNRLHTGTLYAPILLQKVQQYLHSRPHHTVQLIPSGNNDEEKVPFWLVQRRMYMYLYTSLTLKISLFRLFTLLLPTPCPLRTMLRTGTHTPHYTLTQVHKERKEEQRKSENPPFLLYM